MSMSLFFVNLKTPPPRRSLKQRPRGRLLLWTLLWSIHAFWSIVWMLGTNLKTLIAHFLTPQLPQIMPTSFVDDFLFGTRNWLLPCTCLVNWIALLLCTVLSRLRVPKFVWIIENLRPLTFFEAEKDIWCRGKYENLNLRLTSSRKVLASTVYGAFVWNQWGKETRKGRDKCNRDALSY